MVPPTLKDAKRLVIKIGSALLVDPEAAAPRLAWLDQVAHDIARLRAAGTEIIVVSSGAIALARHTLGLNQRRTLRLEEKQAAAAVGQIRLAQAWSTALSKQNLIAAQLLLTPDDTEDRRRYLNARATLTTLLGLGCIPVINENDTIATAEIRFGDNDRLAARVAEMISADQLLLSDIDGLYTADPRTNPDATHIPLIPQITPEIEAMGGAPPPGYSSGGMRTKLMAAGIATRSGCAMAIAQGTLPNPIQALRDGDARCSWFLPDPTARTTTTARKRWITAGLPPTGTLTIDPGAQAALKTGSSLLPAGITKIEGHFNRGDLVTIQDHTGRPLARGLIAYNHQDALKIIGHHSTEIEALLGWRGRDEMVHRDDLVTLASK